MTGFISDNLPLIALALACVIALIKHKGLVDYILLLPVGIGGLWLAFLFLFHPELVASTLGWNPSPFQSDVGAAYLGLSAVGILASFQGKSFKLAVAIMVFFFYGISSIGLFHEVYYMGQDAATGSTALILYTRLLIPSALWVALSLDL